MTAMLGLVVMLHSAGCLALDDAQKAMVTALKYEMGEFGLRETRQQRPPPSFCLMSEGIKVREMAPLEEPIGNGVSKDVISALRARGYNAFSSDDCVYQGDTVRVRGASQTAALLGIELRYGSPDEVIADTSYYGGFCEHQRLRLVRDNDDFVIIERRRTLTC
jgi:hypothetical protein